MSKVSRAEFDRAAREDLRRRALKALDKVSDAEDREITNAAEADPDARPVDELMRRKRGRPPLPETKEKVSLRLDRDVLERFRAEGAGWQTRINDALREAAGMGGKAGR
ncbi:MAG: BrnA antitoxin family protein [Rhizobiaceae bacterium]|nr:BrnA antitoxin family protein [Rhizobiaceae bacterium]MCV0405205.1 BrnA antitoxin family protein [Rhizobiaceae bacterium]